MNRAFTHVLLCLAALLMAACGATPTATPSAIVPAVTLFPTRTPIASATPIPPTATPQPTTTPIPTPSPTPARPEILLSQMSLEQKIGQVMFVGLGDVTVPLIDIQALFGEMHFGGFIIFDSNVQSPAQLDGLIRSFQETVRGLNEPPLFIGIDQEGGLISRLTESKGFAEFPSPMACAATPNALSNVLALAQANAAQFKALGINVVLGPSVDVNNNPANPVIGTRAFGSQPEQVTQLAQAEIGVYQQNGILAVAKHFPGHGDTTQDSHTDLPLVPHDRARLDSVELMPFRSVISAGVAGIMSAHVIFPAVDNTPNLPATLSRKALTDLLRGELHFEGLAMTDSLEMGALAQAGYDMPNAAAAALAAGADLLLFNATPDIYRAVIQQIAAQVKSGQIPPQRLDEAVRRVLRAKERFGLFDAAPVNVEASPAQMKLDEARQLAQTIANQSITIVRDTAKRLPIAAGTPLLVVETGYSSGLGALLKAQTLTINDQPGQNEIDVVLGQSAGKTVVVTTMDAGVNTQQVALVNALINAQVPVIVAATRSPYDALVLGDAPTLVLTYGLPPVSLRALVNVLIGTVPAQGQLPIALGS